MSDIKVILRQILNLESWQSKALQATLVNSLVPLIPFFLCYKFIQGPKVLNAMLSYAAGSLLHEVATHLIPEALKLEFSQQKSKLYWRKQHSHDHSNVAQYVVVGIIIFHTLHILINRILKNQERETKGLAGLATKKQNSFKTSALIGIFSDFTHNFTDGVAIAVSFSISKKQGVATSLAMLAHELPHELTDIALLLRSGYSYWKALRLQFFTAIGAIMGCFFVLLMGNMTAYTKMILISITSSGFIYLVLSEIMPHVQAVSSSESTTTLQLLSSIFFLILGTFGSNILEKMH